MNQEGEAPPQAWREKVAQWYHDVLLSRHEEGNKAISIIFVAMRLVDAFYDHEKSISGSRLEFQTVSTAALWVSLKYCRSNCVEHPQGLIPPKQTSLTSQEVLGMAHRLVKYVDNSTPMTYLNEALGSILLDQASQLVKLTVFDSELMRQSSKDIAEAISKIIFGLDGRSDETYRRLRSLMQQKGIVIYPGREQEEVCHAEVLHVIPEDETTDSKATRSQGRLIRTRRVSSNLVSLVEEEMDVANEP